MEIFNYMGFTSYVYGTSILCKVENSLDSALFKQLPKEIIHTVLEYYGQIYYQNGLYINKIHKYDCRYKLLEHIPKMIYRKVNIFTSISFIYFTNKKYVLVYTYKPFEYCQYLWYNLIQNLEPNNYDLKMICYK